MGLAKSFASYTLHVTTLSAATGEVIASVNIPANNKDEQPKFVAFSTPPGPNTTVCVAWLEDGALKAAALTPDLKGRVIALPGIKYDRIHDFGLSTNGQFLAIKDGGAAQVMHLDPQTASLQVIWEFSDAVSFITWILIHHFLSATSGPFADSFRFTFRRKPQPRWRTADCAYILVKCLQHRFLLHLPIFLMQLTI